MFFLNMQKKLVQNYTFNKIFLKCVLTKLYKKSIAGWFKMCGK